MKLDIVLDFGCCLFLLTDDFKLNIVLCRYFVKPHNNTVAQWILSI